MAEMDADLQRLYRAMQTKHPEFTAEAVGIATSRALEYFAVGLEQGWEIGRVKVRMDETGKPILEKVDILQIER